MLEDIDILELFAGNSQLIPGRIDRAKTVADLVPCASDIQAQVQRLNEQGVKVEVIAEITSDLNRNLISKVFELTAPASIKENGCLFVMGSEGRAEQTLRTDQDNGLLLAAPVPESDLAKFRQAFTESLEACGFPPCPGNVMVRNPVWSQPLDSFIRQLKTWIIVGGGDSAMNLGIFCDSVAIAGQSDLLLAGEDRVHGGDARREGASRPLRQSDRPLCQLRYWRVRQSHGFGGGALGRGGHKEGGHVPNRSRHPDPRHREGHSRNPDRGPDQCNREHPHF